MYFWKRWPDWLRKWKFFWVNIKMKASKLINLQYKFLKKELEASNDTLNQISIKRNLSISLL